MLFHSRKLALLRYSFLIYFSHFVHYLVKRGLYKLLFYNIYFLNYFDLKVKWKN